MPKFLTRRILSSTLPAGLHARLLKTADPDMRKSTPWTHITPWGWHSPRNLNTCFLPTSETYRDTEINPRSKPRPRSWLNHRLLSSIAHFHFSRESSANSGPVGRAHGRLPNLPPIPYSRLPGRIQYHRERGSL